MADSTIPNLTAVSSLASADLVAVRKSGETRNKKATIAQLSDALSSGGGDPVTGFYKSGDSPAFAAVTVGSGTAITKIIKTTATIDPASIAAGVVVEQTFTVTGVLAGDIVIANKPTLTANLVLSNVRASGTDQVAITFYNNNLVAPVDAASETWAFLIVRS